MSSLTLLGLCAPGCPWPPSGLYAGSGPAPTPRRPRRLPRWSPLPRPEKAPSPLPSCSKAARCSCPACAAPKDEGARLWVRSRRAAQARCACRIRPRRRASRARSPRPTSPSMPPLRTRRALLLIVPLFPGGADPRYGAAHRGGTYRESRHELYVLAALLEAREGTLSEVLLQEPQGLLVELRGRSGPLLGGKRFSSSCLVNVSFDRGEAH